MLLLFETPSGFAVFTSSEVPFYLPDTLKDIWAEFADPYRACLVAVLNEFESFEDKSSAINYDTGVNKRLADMIYKWILPGMKLAVGKPEYKTIIESNLGITCTHNAIVREIMWGIQHLMHKLVPEEKAEVAKDDRFPMSQGLKMLLSRYGFDVKPEMVNEQIVATAAALFDCAAVYKMHLDYLASARVCFKKVSDINCEQWGVLKVAAALKVVCCPEEDNFHEVLSENELLKLKDEAPKYKDLMSKVHCMRIYEKISNAHHVRAEKKRLLEFLVKEAKVACEKGKLHGESEQVPEEHVISALKPRYVHELSLPKGLKRSWDSAFEPNVLSKSTFSGPQPSTSKAIVPYKPIPHVPPSILLRVSQNIDGDNMGRDQYINLGKSILAAPLTTTEQVEVEIEATPLASVGDSKDETKLFAEHSEKQVQVQANGGSRLPLRPPMSVSNPSSPFDVRSWIGGEGFVNRGEDKKRLVNFTLKINSK